MALGFFRRNTKMVVWIMVILMGVFILSSVGASEWAKWVSPSGKKKVVGDAGDTKITNNDLAHADKDLKILRDFGLGNPEGMLRRMVTGQARPIPGEHGLLLLLAEPRVGDYVLVHAGFAIQKVDEEEALKTLALLEEAFGPAPQGE